MNHRAPRSIQRRCDVAVIGGSAAGLAAALQLVRQRRSVIVVDAGEPRNSPAEKMHGHLGHEGVAPAEFLAGAREEVRSYGAEVLAGRVTSVTREGEGFVAELIGGHRVLARRVLVATGLVDELPPIEGLAEHWGTSVVHCPFCHGYELRDRRLVHIVTHRMGLHAAALFRHLSDRYTVLVHEATGLDAGALEPLRAAGLPIVVGRAVGVVADALGALVGVRLADGEVLAADALVVTPDVRARAEMLAPLGITPERHPSGFGEIVVTDARGSTAVPGLYAAGNVTDPSHQVVQAAADGARVGAMIAFDLADDDLRAEASATAHELDWEHRYESGPMWSGAPNATLVAEIAGRPVGRALDVGAGEGADAVWLAERGWRVTASDVSGRALARVASHAHGRGVAIECQRADANAVDPFGGQTFDLVTAHYASIPRTPDHRAVINMLGAVAPGGLLLVVGHALEEMRSPVDTWRHSRAFDPDAYVRVEDVVAHLAHEPGWEIEVYERRPRQSGATPPAHHPDDVVLRARRAPRTHPDQTFGDQPASASRAPIASSARSSGTSR